MVFNLKAYEEITQKIRDFYPQSKLLVVSKNRSQEDLSHLIFEKKHKLFGENRIQEAQKKFSKEFVDKLGLEIHLIGPLQTNKVDSALQFFHTIQSIDRLKLVKEIKKSIQKKKSSIITKNFFIQVNIGDEPQKSGITAKELPALYEQCIELDINVKGLMCIPPNNVNPEKYFKKMQNLKTEINPNLELSMGMSGDYEEALKCESDMIRVGSILFK